MPTIPEPAPFDRPLREAAVLLHAGNATTKLAVDHCLAVPLARLWDM